ncbi:MAG: PrsW family intramembrane metalloprotease, partial [Bacteroidaceae bacterium]|nr:PrsW family intramembrane metalloprotease [Bacteroidaceae bacterium]
KPWVFYPMLKAGLAFILFLYLSYFVMKMMGIGIPFAIEGMVIIFPPLVMPVVIMVFFWELNIPKNVSVFSLFGIWLAGGVASLVVTMLFAKIVPDEWPPCFSAPAMEEPGKLIVAMLVMFVVGRKMKIYGITGFVIGAAVGAGFAAFESAQYAFNAAQSISEATDGHMIAIVAEYSMSRDVLHSQLLRMLTATGGHVFYCAPYIAELARHTKNNRITVGSFLNVDFIGAFLISCLLHGLWDVGFITLPFKAVFKLFVWAQGLRILRKCLNQVVQIGAVASGGGTLMHGAAVDDDYADHVVHVERPEEKQKPLAVPEKLSNAEIPDSIKVSCSAGEFMGVSWHLCPGQELLVGRDSSCGVHFSASAKGVSGRHCIIRHTQFGWTVKDLGSTYGTFVSGNQKVLPNTEVKIGKGDTISLGGNENVLLID